jgi:hypothetical protein
MLEQPMDCDEPVGEEEPSLESEGEMLQQPANVCESIIKGTFSQKTL